MDLRKETILGGNCGWCQDF